MIIPFYKYHANGNDFILICSVDTLKFGCNFKKQYLIKPIIEKITGIGADGILYVRDQNNSLRQLTKYDFNLDYYNSDGSWETFCANGSRCAAKLMYDLNYVNKIMKFKTGAGLHSAKIGDDGYIKMDMIVPKYISKLMTFSSVIYLPCAVEVECNLRKQFSVLRIGLK